MTPAPEHWRRWKRGQRAMAFAREPAPAENEVAGQAENDQRVSRAVLRATALVAVVLAVAAFLRALLSAASPEVALAGGTHRVSAALACWIEVHRAPSRSDQDRSGPCDH